MIDWRRGLHGFHRPGLWRAIGWFGIGLLIALSLVHPPHLDTGFDNSDKLGHFSAYFTLTAWYGQLFAARRDFLLRAAAFALLGAALEIAQGYTDYRSSDWRDELANCSGILAAVLFSRLRWAQLRLVAIDRRLA